MKSTSISRLALTLALPALLLAGCGRQEAVGDVPSNDELARAADLAIANAAANESVAADQAAAALEYVNAIHGFAFYPPEGWVRDASASTAEGVVFQDPSGGAADIRVFWQKNDGDTTMQDIVEAMNDGATGAEGDFVGDNEYRGTSSDGEGNTVAVRLIRKADGSLISATFVYPEALADQYKVIGGNALASLKITETAEKAEAAKPAATTTR